MAVKIYKPKTPGQRHRTSYTFEEITKDRPERSLLVTGKKTAGRNALGRVTVRHRGGGSKRQIRVVDFLRNKAGIPAKVSAIEYDPNRTARLALLVYADGEKRYILAPLGVKVGDVLVSGAQAEIKPGNNLPLANIPVGTTIHAIELQPGKGAQIGRSAGSSAQLLAKEGKYANVDHSNVKLGKAGRARHMGLRPEVRGTAMSPRDHPHGGGEGRTSIGMPGPKTPWGKPTLGYKTRTNKRTDKMIIRHRSKAKRR